MESVAEGRRCAENDSKGDKCYGPSGAETDLSDAQCVPLGGPSRCDPKCGQREGAHVLLAPSAGASFHAQKIQTKINETHFCQGQPLQQ